eukprot:Sspe_Gene.39503::Locus_19056_Transcript_1_1_Confidence_1.000_Length_1431::g.39503::m.39503
MYDTMQPQPVPPSREELERLPLPELLKRAAGLGIDVTLVHDRSDIVDALVQERRQLLSRYADELLKFKIKLEGQAQEVDLAQQQYQGTYDRVEQGITDRFAQLHDQLLRKEVEIRGHLAYLKNNGDEVLNDCRAAMDRELSLLDQTLQKCQSRNVDVLEITPSHTPIIVTVPHITGRCFEFSDIGALDLTNLHVSLDLQVSSKSIHMASPFNTHYPQARAGNTPGSGGGYKQQQQYPPVSYQQSPSSPHNPPGRPQQYPPPPPYGSQGTSTAPPPRLASRTCSECDGADGNHRQAHLPPR